MGSSIFNTLRNPQRNIVINNRLLSYIAYIGGLSSPEVACWTSDHWVADSNPLGVCFINNFNSSPCACLVQFSLNNVVRGSIKHRCIVHCHYFTDFY